MRKLLAVAGVSLLKTWKDKHFIIIMIATALGFTALTGLMFGRVGGGVRSLVPVGVIDHDNSELSRGMIAGLTEAGSYDVRSLSEEEVYEDVRLGDVETGFIIPAGFEDSVAAGAPLSVTVVSLANSNTGMVAGTIMEKGLTTFLLERAVMSVTASSASELGVADKVDPASAARNAIRQLNDSPSLTVAFLEVKQEAAVEDVPTWSAGYSVGIYLMFTMFTIVFQAGEVLEERRTGTWGRLLSTPVSRAAILGGKALGSYVVGFFQILTLILVGRYVFHINFGPNMGAVIAILALMVAVVTGLGLFLSTVVRTTAQLQATAPIVIVATCMLGGCYWPLEMVSPVMQQIAKVTPQAWAMSALTDVVLRGKGLSSTIPSLAVLACFGVVFFVLGALRTKFE